jgi:3D (Asp-Asp-Asp) domain-containing protein
MISNLARGSIFLGFSLFLAVFFCFQPKVEANNSEKDSQKDLQQNFNQTDNTENDLISQQKSEINQQQLESPQSQTLPSANLETESKIENKATSVSRAFRATAYCLQGRTATGGSVRRGIVAADRRVLPLGTRIQITAGSYSGTYTVADTGGAVRGRILDVWVPSCAEAMRFGRKNVMVSVLTK